MSRRKFAGLPRLGPVDFPTLGFQIVDWIETFIPHGPGPVSGDPFELDEEEVRHLCWTYRLKPGTGRRTFRRVVRVAPKGRRKSEVAGALVCVEALGPCRFDHWAAKGEVSSWGYEFDEGEPVGRPLSHPKIRCLATEEDQAGNTYDNVYDMLRSPRFARWDQQVGKGTAVGLTRTFLPSGGEIHPSTATGASKEGGGETFGVFDEPHLYLLPAVQNMHRVVSRNVAKTAAINDGWTYETSNSYLPGQNSVLERAHDFAVKLGSLEAMVEAGFLYDHVQPTDALEGDAWEDDDKVKAAVRDVYGPAREWIDVDRILSEIRDPESTEPDARRFWLNQVVAGAEAWMPLPAWDRCASNETLQRGDAIALGFDGSLNDDATALVGCRLSDGLIQVLGLWERPFDSLQAWEVDQRAVDAKVADVMRDFAVLRMYADPPFWQDYLDKWASEWGEVVIEWWTNRETPMWKALERLHTAVMSPRDTEAPGLLHTGDRDLRRHIGNSHRRRTRAGYVIEKRRPRDPRKMDLAMAAALAYEARGDCIADGLTGRSTYEDHDLLVL